MTENERYEVTAEAFRILTGFLAPGKDEPMAAGPVDQDQKLYEWSNWHRVCGKTISAMTTAFERIMESENE